MIVPYLFACEMGMVVVGEEANDVATSSQYQEHEIDIHDGELDMVDADPEEPYWPGANDPHKLDDLWDLC